MKSREGTVVDADTLIDQMQKLAQKEISKREKSISKTELKKRSQVIALSGLKYMLLKIDIMKNMLFDPKESISFEGNTGPYLLYSYARANSILNKFKKEPKIIFSENLEEKETELILKLNEFPRIVKKSYGSLNPSLIATYSYELSKIFNEFYHSHNVLKSNKEEFRISLVNSFRQVLKNSLYLLGIGVLEKM